MPYTSKQKKLARAVSHGFKPTGSASGFSKSFAEQMLEETAAMKARKKAAEDRMGRGARSNR